MKTEVLNLTSAVDQAGAMHIASILQSVPGVSRVAISTAAGRVTVDFDGDRTSAQELHALLERAGCGTKNSSHAERGMCCGSCGG